jgi:predicted NBD/HSP70 family sugar kinase
VSESVEALERRIERLRVAVRETVLVGDRERAIALRAELRHAERAWEEALDQLAAALAPSTAALAPSTAALATGPTSPPATARKDGPLLPLREQVHQALSLLTVPAAPRLIATVHEAFFAGTFPNARLTSLKRDEERSFRTAPFARPYYICAALTADLLAPARGLLAISTWPMERRVIGSLSPRVDFLTAAIQVAEAIERLPAPVPAARRLLWRFAASIPGAADSAGQIEPRTVTQAGRAELEVHEPDDRSTRHAAAMRARAQLDDAQQLFGSRLTISSTRRGS